MQRALCWILFAASAMACQANAVGVGGYCRSNDECVDGLICRTRSCQQPPAAPDGQGLGAPTPAPEPEEEPDAGVSDDGGSEGPT